MHVVNTDTLSHHKNSPDKRLQTSENQKKQKYLETCLRQRHHFPPFFVSVDGILRVEAEATLKQVVEKTQICSAKQ